MKETTIPGSYKNLMRFFQREGQKIFSGECFIVLKQTNQSDQKNFFKKRKLGQELEFRDFKTPQSWREK